MKIKQECIPVGCVPPARWPYLVVCPTPWMQTLRGCRPLSPWMQAPHSPGCRPPWCRPWVQTNRPPRGQTNTYEHNLNEIRKQWLRLKTIACLIARERFRGVQPKLKLVKTCCNSWFKTNIDYLQKPLFEGWLNKPKKDSYSPLKHIYFYSNYLFVFYLKLQDQYNDKVYYRSGTVNSKHG